MKFRTLGVALAAGGGLTLAALPASPALAIDNVPPPTAPYLPAGGGTGSVAGDCVGPVGEGVVSKSVVLVGESVVFSGCGFVPGTTVTIERNGTYVTTTTPSAIGLDAQDRNRRDRDRNGNTCVIAGAGVGVVGAGGGVGAAGAPGGAALPFTGVETGVMASIAVALLGGGALLRVAARRRRAAGAAVRTEA